MVKKSGPKTKEERNLRREEVLGFIETLGPYSVPINMLAEKHDVALTIIYGDIKFWIKKMDFRNIDIEGRKLIKSLMKNMSITETLKAEGTVTEKIRAVQASNQTAEVMTKLMEQYGFKEKVAEKVEHSGDLPAIINLVEKSVEEIKRDKLNNKPKAESDASGA